MKKTLLSCFMALVLLTTLTSPVSASFTDIYSDIEGTWYEEAAVSYAYPEIFSDGSGLLEADKKITRIEFVRLLHKAMDLSFNYFDSIDISSYFDDMTNGAAGADALNDLVTAGIIKPGGNFSPELPLERELMIHWVVTALDYMTGGNYPIALIMPMPFDDEEDINTDYTNDVIQAVILGLVNGRGDNMLYPKDGATRAEALTIIYRLIPLSQTLKEDVTVNAEASVLNDTLCMTLTIRNNTDEDITLHYTSGQQFDFQLYDADGNCLYTWSADKLFTMALSDMVIEPGAQVTYSAVLDENTYGEISDSAVLLKAFITGTSDNFDISSDGYEADI